MTERMTPENRRAAARAEAAAEDDAAERAEDLAQLSPDAKSEGDEGEGRRLFGSRLAGLFWNALRDSAVVAGRAYKHFDADEGGILAGYIAYAMLLALFPFMIFTAALASALVGPEELQAAIDWLFATAPPNVADTLAPVLTDVLGQERGGLLTISAGGALWAASNGVEAFRAAFDRAYESRRVRNFALRRIIGMAYVLLGSATFALLGFAIVLAPLLFTAVEGLFGVKPPFGAGLLRYGVGIGAFIGFLWALHRFLPSRSQRGARLLPGIVSTLLLWMAGATAFSVYLANAPSYSVTYGSIAGVIVTLLFFYLTGAAIIFGAEINAALERLTGEALRRRAEEERVVDAAEARRQARQARREARKAVTTAKEAAAEAKAVEAAEAAAEATAHVEPRKA
ncbi:YihY/virulence factor BrkB family protein [Rhodovulum sp. DZ06]|uniref:YihY/virulence factor BrkB family protein n=1 Tax=Rhodovulum sp. DZ06 TaxID=3425126 RepID=UPI003D34DEBA